MKVLKNNFYTIVEKTDAGTPLPLKERGKFKMGNYSEPISCYYNDVANRYETGLNKHSIEFRGKEAEEVDKILADRNDLIVHLALLLEQTGKSEKDFLAEYYLTVKHNLRIDTSNMDDYLKLFLATRGHLLTPEKEKGNKGKYSNSLWLISNTKEEVDAKNVFRDKKDRVRSWFYSNYDDDKKGVEAILIYEGILGAKQVKPKAVISDIIEKVITNVNKLDSLLYTIEKVPNDEVLKYNLLREKIRTSKIRKEGRKYYFEGIDLGSNIKSIIAYLNNPENIEVSERILE